MKKLVLILLITLSTKTFAQNDKEHYVAFSAAVDIKNLLVGSYPTDNKSALDYFLQFSLVSNNIEVNIGYERFQRVQFSKNTVGIGYHFPLYLNIGSKELKFVFIPSAEPTIINRWGTWGGGLSYEQASSHLSLGANLALRISLSDKIALEYLFNALPRIDIHGKYDNNNWQNRASTEGVPIVGSNYFKLIYKINRAY
nr:hypothetical protein [uncultured Flavobacterium sp.]